MKHLRKYNESSDNFLTWNKIINDDSVDFISDQKITDVEEKKQFLRGYRSSMDFNEPIKFDNPDPRYIKWYVWTKWNIMLCSNYDLSVVLVFKNEELFAVISIYELHGCSLFKETVVVYGHESIILYDIQDFQFKYIPTR